jgi:hypothetical protein
VPPDDPPPSLTCVDCGEDARLLVVSEPDEHGERVAAYRCTGCLDRWDVVVEGAPPASDHGSGPAGPPPEGEAPARGAGRWR